MTDSEGAIQILTRALAILREITGCLSARSDFAFTPWAVPAALSVAGEGLRLEWKEKAGIALLTAGAHITYTSGCSVNTFRLAINALEKCS